MRSILRYVAAAALSLLFAAPSVLAQDSNKSVKELDGYYRIVNARTGQYVNITDPFSAGPNIDLNTALTSPGSVFLIDANVEWNLHHKEAFRINQLRSQGIDVIGQESYSVADFVKDFDNAATCDIDRFIYSLLKSGLDHVYLNAASSTLELFVGFMAGPVSDKYINEAHDFQAGDAGRVKNVTADFVKNIAAQISPRLFLEPVKTKSGEKSYRLYYDVANLQAVSDWYLGNNGYESHKADFDLGLEAMRLAMSANGIDSGEHLNAVERAEMKSWGYDVESIFGTPESNPENYDTKGLLTPYEKIFADPELLFNWLKLTAVKFTDPNRAPDVAVKGMNFKELATKLNNLGLTSQLIDYLPNLYPDRRYCLIAGKLTDGAAKGADNWTDNGNRFGFISQAGAITTRSGDADKWFVVPVDDNTDNYYAIAPGEQYSFDAATEKVNVDAESFRRANQQGSYQSLFLDFPISAEANRNVRFFTISNSVLSHNAPDANRPMADNDLEEFDYPVIVNTSRTAKVRYYYEIEEIGLNLAMQTPALAIVDADAANNKVKIPYATLVPSYTINSNPIVSGDEGNIGHRAPAADNGRTAPEHSVLKGVLFPAEVNALNALGYESHDANVRPAYTLSIQSGTVNPRYFEKNSTTIASNQAFLIAPLNNGYTTETGDKDKIYIARPAEDITTGISAVEADDASEAKVIFDIYGRRVAEMLPGNIYIVNGRKTICK